MNDHDLEARPAADTGRPEPSDAELAALVREAAAGWVAPPRRLGQSTWRDRVERGGRAGRPWWRRLSGAVAAAVAATIVLSLVAAWISTPRRPLIAGAPSLSPAVAASPSGAAGTQGSSVPASPAGLTAGPVAATPGSPSVASSVSPSASPSVAPSATAPIVPPGPPATALPVPSPMHARAPLPDRALMVGVEAEYRLLDLASGDLSAPLARRYAGASSAMWREPDGSYLCACLGSLSTTDAQGRQVDGQTLSIRRLSADGRTLSSLDGYARSTTVDPRRVQSAASVLLLPAVSSDHRRLFVGWTMLTDQGWQDGVDVLSVDSGALLASLQLPDDLAGPPGDVESMALRVAIAPDGRTAMFIRTAYSIAGIAGDHRFATVGADGSLTLGPALSGATFGAASCSQFGTAEGFATSAIYYRLCDDGTLRRSTTDGRSLEPLPLRGLTMNAVAVSGGPLLDQARGRLYLWDPFAHRLTAVDGTRGAIVGEATAPALTAETSPLDRFVGALGHWVAPTASAKILLLPSVALSPDGSRLYALGVTGTGIEDGGGSAGVFVFETSSPSYVGRFAPTADLYGIALSSDGSVLYASGMAGVDASGAKADQAASLTAFDARTGQVRLLLGNLAAQTDLWLGDWP